MRISDIFIMPSYTQNSLIRCHPPHAEEQSLTQEVDLAGKGARKWWWASSNSGALTRTVLTRLPRCPCPDRETKREELNLSRKSGM